MQLPLSPYDNYCVGYENPGVEGTGYLMALNIGVGKVKERWSHAGSEILDKTLAFDTAEVEGANLGQINMITVSSFCGPEGKIWGLDLAVAPRLRAKKLGLVERVPYYDAEPLLIASKALLGTVEVPKFPFLPGSHVPCASKLVSVRGNAVLYAAIAVGVPKNRREAACLMMEDVGAIGGQVSSEILQSLAESVIEVGRNQRVKYREIFTGIKTIEVSLGEVGCALVAAPYMAIAQGAVRVEKEKLRNMSLKEWQNSVE